MAERRERRRPRVAPAARRSLLLGAMVTAVATVTACSGASTDPRPAPATGPPLPASDRNVVVVVVDDASDIACDRFADYMPRTAALLRDRGTCFEEATAAGPTCAPSRASLMTSQLSHNNGAPLQTDADQVRVEDTLQATLGRAGWTTYGTGKYFNGLPVFDVEAGTLDSGFASSDFWGSSKPYGYQLWDDETQQPSTPGDGVHATTRTGDFLRRFIASQEGVERPFYAYAAFKAPHTDNSARTLTARMPRATPRNRDRPVPTFETRWEADTRDKLPVFQGTLAPRGYYARLHAARIRALYDVDDEMGKMIAELRRTNELDDTAIFFTSDQGYHLGENGWETKGDPYPATSDVPLLAWIPDAVPTGRVDTSPVSGLDVGPTVYELTGTTPDHQVDGRSLLAPRPREGLYSEGFSGRTRLDMRGRSYHPGRIPTWAMYRAGGRAYIEYYDPAGATIQREFYRDAAMTDNILARGSRARPSTKTLAEFRDQLRRARTCAGTDLAGAVNPCP